MKFDISFTECTTKWLFQSRKETLKCCYIPPGWHRIKQCLGYLNMQERDRGTSATALAAFHAPSLKPTYVALLPLEGRHPCEGMQDRAAGALRAVVGSLKASAEHVPGSSSAWNCRQLETRAWRRLSLSAEPDDEHWAIYTGNLLNRKST